MLDRRFNEIMRASLHKRIRTFLEGSVGVYKGYFKTFCGWKSNNSFIIH